MIPGSAFRRRKKKSYDTIADGSQAAPSAREEVRGDDFADHAVRAIADSSREAVRSVECDTGKDLPLFAKPTKNGRWKADVFARAFSTCSCSAH